ncbi:uncharacterized protein F4822DRAFT_407219 [Hypoxylon trugodes]|uniref:uncharacterized protein n=1 Tax=Hypoxylon trugodes TaxID=326681 RepID=UPI002198276E|nr:uncharacterized protein F4822DRAFT_407219 [Hypoxylon trugodes]KAI1387649.1 hypothetical protein F4822DRAFT_407219 [Hypoxylon trugodes]
MSINASRVVWSTDWQPPAITELNFDPSNATICAAAGAWMAADVNTFQDEEMFMTTNFVTNFLRAILPLDTTPPDNMTLILWYDGFIRENIDDLSQLQRFALYNCAPDVCKNLNWEGDPDVSGRGMLITYYLAAGMVTIYLCALALSGSGIFRQNYPSRSRRAWLIGGFEASASTFLDAALIFAVSMLAAACFRLSQAFFQEYGVAKGHWMIYASIGSIYMSTFSSLLPLLLQATAPGIRRHWLRITLWALTIILGIVNEGLFDSFFFKITDPKMKDTLELVWLQYCSPINLLSYGITPTLRIAQGLLVLNTIFYIIYLRYHGKGRNDQTWPKTKNFWRKAIQYIQILNVAICCLLMWSMVATFHYYRDLVDRAAGDDNQNSAWTFGQVLAVATWIPVLVELATILKYGTKEGLARKISKKYAIVLNNAPTHDEEKGSQYSRVENRG